MRLSGLAVATFASIAANTSAFAPNANGVSRAPLTINMASNNNEVSTAMDSAKNGLLSAVAASMIFLSPGPALVEPAYAAAPAAQSVATKTATTSKTVAKKEEPVKADPLAAEKAALAAAKKKYTESTAAVTSAKKTLNDDTTALGKAETASKNADNKVTSAKKALIQANDKLADAKAKEGSGSAAALKNVEALAGKVGKLFMVE